MNTILAVASLRPDYDEVTSDLFDRAQQHLLDLLRIPKSRSRQHRREGVHLFNSNVAAAWTVPVHIERDGVCVSMTSPAIPTDQNIGASYETFILDRTRTDDGLVSLNPGYMGFRSGGGSLACWSDVLGIGRAYYIRNEKFFAASNSISALLYFTTKAIEIDHAEWAASSSFGWFSRYGAPFKDVYRMRPGQIFRIGRDRIVSDQIYVEMNSIVKPDHETFDQNIQEAAREIQTTVSNATTMFKGRPTLGLSGGKDSRLTTAAWISAGAPAKVWTDGTIIGEAEVAADLMARIDTNVDVEHQITYKDIKRSSTPQTDSLPERLQTLHSKYDGDRAPVSMKSTFGSSLLEATRPHIGGAGGEIASGNYYSNERIIDFIKKSAKPYDRLRRSFAEKNGATEEGANEVARRLDEVYDEAVSYNLGPLASLDYFYLVERFRRWAMAGASTNSLLLFAVPSFVRLAFSSEPEQKFRKEIHSHLTKAFMPAWGDIPYYKATLGDSQVPAVQAKRLWNRHDKDWLYDTLQGGEIYPRYIDRNYMLNAVVEVLRGNGLNWHESLIQRALWVETFYQYAKGLSDKIERQKKDALERSGFILDRGNSGSLPERARLPTLRSTPFGTNISETALRKKDVVSLGMDTHVLAKCWREAGPVNAEQPSPELIARLERTPKITEEGVRDLASYSREELPYSKLRDTLLYEGVPYYNYKALKDQSTNVMHPMRNGRFILQNAKGTMGKYVADALLALAHKLPNGGLAWYYPRHYSVARMLGSKLKYSAISQGTILSGFIGLAKKRDDISPDIARQVFKAMLWPFERGGVNLGGRAVLEMPSFTGPPEIVLNGWLDALIHLRDYAVLSEDDEAIGLVRKNMDFLVELLGIFDAPNQKLSLYSDLCPYRVSVNLARPEDHESLTALYVPRYDGFDPVAVPIAEPTGDVPSSPYENHIARRNGRKSLVWLSASGLCDTYLVAKSKSMEMVCNTGVYDEKQASPGTKGRELQFESAEFGDGLRIVELPDHPDIFRGYPTNFANNKVVNFYHPYHVVALMLVAMGDLVNNDQRRSILQMAFRWYDYMQAFADRTDIEFNDLQDILTKLNMNQSRIVYDDWNKLLAEAREALGTR